MQVLYSCADNLKGKTDVYMVTGIYMVQSHTSSHDGLVTQYFESWTRVPVLKQRQEIPSFVPLGWSDSWILVQLS